MRSPITTHILDTALGCPAVGVEVTLGRLDSGVWQALDSRATDGDGRVGNFAGLEDFHPGRYRLCFDLDGYREGSFFPEAQLIFRVEDITEHYHVPLLLSPFGFTTYRGS